MRLGWARANKQRVHKLVQIEYVRLCEIYLFTNYKNCYYINHNSPQKSRFYLIIIINHGGVCYCMNGMMRPHDSYVSICKTICPLLKKKVLFVFMFPFRIMVLTRKNNFHTTHTTIYYRRMYVKFLRHKVIMTWNSLQDFRRSWYGARNWRRWTEVDLIQSLSVLFYFT